MEKYIPELIQAEPDGLDECLYSIDGKYLHVHETMPRADLLKINGSTEIAFKAGLNCQMVTGDPMNFKITTPEDLSNFQAIINEQ